MICENCYFKRHPGGDRAQLMVAGKCAQCGSHGACVKNTQGQKAVPATSPEPTPQTVTPQTSQNQPLKVNFSSIDKSKLPTVLQGKYSDWELFLRTQPNQGQLALNTMTSLLKSHGIELQEVLFSAPPIPEVDIINQVLQVEPPYQTPPPLPQKKIVEHAPVASSPEAVKDSTYTGGQIDLHPNVQISNIKGDVVTLPEKEDSLDFLDPYLKVPPKAIITRPAKPVYKLPEFLSPEQKILLEETAEQLTLLKKKDHKALLDKLPQHIREIVPPSWEPTIGAVISNGDIGPDDFVQLKMEQVKGEGPLSKTDKEILQKNGSKSLEYFTKHFPWLIKKLERQELNEEQKKIYAPQGVPLDEPKTAIYKFPLLDYKGGHRLTYMTKSD